MRAPVRSLLLRGALAAVLAGSGVMLPACSRDGGSASSGAAAALKRDQVALLLAALEQAPSHGFRPGAFGETGLAERLKTGGRPARGELRAAVLAYARALHGQVIPRRDFDPKWGVKADAFDAEASFTQAARTGELKAWVAALAPPSPQYQELRKGYAAYQAIAAKGGWPPLTGRGDLRPGAAGPAVAALRQRLAVEDAAAAQAGAGDRFDAALVQAVQRAQQRYGLHPTGVVDADTRAALNVPVEGRLAQIRANLERLRWMPRTATPDRIEVNTAAGLVDVYQGGQRVMSMLAAAGKPGDESPILVSRVESVVLNPTWNVPDGIADNELRPKGGEYLQRLGFVETSDEGGGARLVQQPGPQNALGRVKFLFDNRYSVYLHDTPSRAAFTREQRSVSHGCVRLAQAVELARRLLAAEPGWSAERVDEVLAGPETTTVKLSRPLPVALMYMTAFTVDGGVAFRPDVYGWDAEVLRRLDAGGSGRA
jgi:murein L,D-transpeptidase YcbB/YkuD